MCVWSFAFFFVWSSPFHFFFAFGGCQGRRWRPRAHPNKKKTRLRSHLKETFLHTECVVFFFFWFAEGPGNFCHQSMAWLMIHFRTRTRCVHRFTNSQMNCSRRRRRQQSQELDLAPRGNLKERDPSKIGRQIFSYLASASCRCPQHHHHSSETRCGKLVISSRSTDDSIKSKIIMCY